MFYVRSERKIILILTTLTVAISSASGESQSQPSGNVSCGGPRGSEFPEDLFSEAQRKCGAVVLHFLFAVYCFGAIALVCSQRFLPTITCICEDLALSDDVAAATFMSIATSAPELFSNIIGTFVTETDIGVGHIIGNGYYNMFFVAAVGGVAAKTGVPLDWWPLTRDCAIYALVALLLTAVVWDGVVHTHETLLLLALYVVYFFVMFNDQKIKRVACRALKVQGRGGEKETAEDAAGEEGGEGKADLQETDPLDSENGFTPPPLPPPPAPTAHPARWNSLNRAFAAPITLLIRLTIPDVRLPRLRRFYPAAFLLCVAWIGLSTYLGTWMVSVIGQTFGIPDLVVGMVFMAAGGSVVETYCVYWKAKRGECSIGLSNALGCNNLDATLCLALPWFFKTLPLLPSDCHPNSVLLDSPLIHLNSLLLLVSALALLAVFYFNSFTLDRKLGLICAATYAVVLFLAISVETHGRPD